MCRDETDHVSDVDGKGIDSAGLLEAIRGGAECAVVLVNNGWPIEDKGTFDRRSADMLACVKLIDICRRTETG